MPDPKPANVLDHLMRIEAKLDALMAHLGATGRPAASSNGARPPSGSTGEVAPDHDLDGEHGNPAIRKDPHKWDAERDGSFIGCTYSECPPEYLDMVASTNDWRADQDDAKGAAGEKNPKGYPKSGRFARMDAARARGWAARKRREGGGAPGRAPAPPDDQSNWDDDIPSYGPASTAAQAHPVKPDERKT